MPITTSLRTLLSPTSFYALGSLLMLAGGHHRRLWRETSDPLGWLGGALGGLAAYYGTVTFVFGAPIAVPRYLDALQASCHERRLPARGVAKLMGRAILEETIWRGTIQPDLGNGVSGLLATALLFTLRHAYLYRINNRPLPVRPFMEFLIFSLLLGLVYQVTGRLSAVMALHLTRDLLISTRCAFPSGQ